MVPKAKAPADGKNGISVVGGGLVVGVVVSVGLVVSDVGTVEVAGVDEVALALGPVVWGTVVVGVGVAAVVLVGAVVEGVDVVVGAGTAPVGGRVGVVTGGDVGPCGGQRADGAPPRGVRLGTADAAVFPSSCAWARRLAAASASIPVVARPAATLVQAARVAWRLASAVADGAGAASTMGSASDLRPADAAVDAAWTVARIVRTRIVPSAANILTLPVFCMRCETAVILPSRPPWPSEPIA